MDSSRKTSPRAGASITPQPRSGPSQSGQPQQQPEPIHSQSRLATHFDQAPVAVLNAKQSADSAPALYLACKTGQRSTINAFAKVVDKFKDKLDETQRAQLFDGLHKGESASAVARRQGYLGASTALELQRRRHFSSRTIDLAG